MNTTNYYLSKDLLINQISKEERLKLKQSLLGQIVKINVNEKFGLFTKHGFPVAVATYQNVNRNNKPPKCFYAKVISVEPMITIYEIPYEA